MLFDVQSACAGTTDATDRIEGDPQELDSILAAKGLDPTRRGAGEDTSLAQGTSGWKLFGANIITTGEAGIA